MANITTPTVLVIGAGLAGLSTCKSAVECGLSPTVLEKGSMIGGGWSNEGFAPDNMQTNVSKHTCMFSDFEWKKGTPDFPTREMLNEYLCDYAETFKIHPYIHLNSEVRKVYQKEKKWVVEWTNKYTGHVQTFD